MSGMINARFHAGKNGWAPLAGATNHGTTIRHGRICSKPTCCYISSQGNQAQFHNKGSQMGAVASPHIFNSEQTLPDPTSRHHLVGTIIPETPEFTLKLVGQIALEGGKSSKLFGGVIPIHGIKHILVQ
jgi:hypothetical protein